MSLLEHARKELQLIGLLGFDGYEPPEYEREISACVLKLVDIFAQQGHSGFSAGMVTGIVTKLMSYELLSPLQGTDDEWELVFEEMLGPNNKGKVYQNIRCSHVFKDDDGAYDIDGIIWNHSGNFVTNKNSRVKVTFPYIPKREYADYDDPRNIKE